MMYGMTPFARNAFNLFNVFDDMDKEFFSGTSTRGFRTDIRDAGEKYIMESELPGFEKDEISIDINGDYLIISAQKKSETSSDSGETETTPEYKYIRRERNVCSYKRSFGISEVNAEAITAAYKNGILTVELPKKKPAEPVAKRLEIM